MKYTKIAKVSCHRKTEVRIKMNKQVSVYALISQMYKGKCNLPTPRTIVLQKNCKTVWKVPGFPQTTQHFLVTDKLCGMFPKKHIQGGLLSLFFFWKHQRPGNWKDSLQQCVSMCCLDRSNTWHCVLWRVCGSFLFHITSSWFI